MTDQNAAAQAEGAGTPAPVSDTSQVDDKKPAQVENAGEATAPDDGAITPEESARPKRNGYQKRIDELVREREQWRELAMRAVPDPNKPTQAAQTVSEGAPEIGQFDDYDKYLVALAKHELKQEQAREAKEQSEREVRAAREKAGGAFRSKVSELSQRIPDLQDAVDLAFSGGIPVSDAMAEAIVEGSDRGPEILHHLVNNPDEAARIAKLTPTAAAIAIARLEAKLPSLEPKRVTAAPAPPSRVTGVADAGQKDPSQMSMAEYAAWYRSRK